MAVNSHGFARNTEDIDLVVETGISNEGKVLEVLSLLPDGAAQPLRPDEVAESIVVREGDEITVDLMARTCGHDYQSTKTVISTVVVKWRLDPFLVSHFAVENKLPAGRAGFLRDSVAQKPR
jgi:hypothetical protein